MAGAVGAGGLGDLAIRYGYDRFETDIMVGVIVVLIVIVSAVQPGAQERLKVGVSGGDGELIGAKVKEEPIGLYSLMRGTTTIL